MCIHFVNMANSDNFTTHPYLLLIFITIIFIYLHNFDWSITIMSLDFQPFQLFCLLPFFLHSRTIATGQYFIYFLIFLNNIYFNTVTVSPV